MSQKLNKQECLRLQELSNIFSWRFTISVKEHFNNAGKYQSLVDAPTEEEKQEQKQAIKGLFYMTETESTIATLKVTDIFMRIALRVGNENEMGALLPAGAFSDGDVALLEKCQLNSLAATVRARMGLK